MLCLRYLPGPKLTVEKVLAKHLPPSVRYAAVALGAPHHPRPVPPTPSHARLLCVDLGSLAENARPGLPPHDHPFFLCLLENNERKARSTPSVVVCLESLKCGQIHRRIYV